MLEPFHLLTYLMSNVTSCSSCVCSYTAVFLVTTSFWILDFELLLLCYYYNFPCLWSYMAWKCSGHTLCCNMWLWWYISRWLVSLAGLWVDGEPIRPVEPNHNPNHQRTTHTIPYIPNTTDFHLGFFAILGKKMIGIINWWFLWERKYKINISQQPNSIMSLLSHLCLQLSHKNHIVLQILKIYISTFPLQIITTNK